MAWQNAQEGHETHERLMRAISLMDKPEAKYKVRIGSLVEWKGESYSVENVRGSSSCYLCSIPQAVSVRELKVIEY